MAIDAHRHFWRYNAEEFGWIDDAPLKRDFLPGDAARFDACIAVEARQSVAETEWLLSLAAEHDFIKGVVGWLPIAAHDFGARLAQFELNAKLVGLRHVIQDEPDDDFILDTQFNRGVSCLISRGLAYDILVYEKHLANVARFVDMHPDDARFVIDHFGKPADFDTWRVLIADVARRPNVRCKLSGLVTELAKSLPPDALDTPEKLDLAAAPYLDTVLEAFGPWRLMFASDWPVVTAQCGYDAWKGVVTRFVSRLSAGEREAVMGGAAAEFYRHRQI